MIDREKVIKGLETCKSTDKTCSDCPYNGEVCTTSLCDDVLTLLKEQETEWEHLWDAPDGTFKGRCKKCGFVHFFIEGHAAQYKFCPECGRSVK